MATPVEARILEDLVQTLHLVEQEYGKGEFTWSQLTPYSAFEVHEFDDEGAVIGVHYVSVQINPSPKENR